MIRIFSNISNKRWKRLAVEIAVFLLIFAVIRAYMHRELISGTVPKTVVTLSDGQTLTLGENREPLLLYFWASWCAVCRFSQDNITELGQSHRVITVAMQSGNAAEVKKYMDQHRLDLKVVLDPDGELARQFGVSAVPTSFVIAPGGQIQFQETGYTTSWGLKLRLWWAGL